MATKKNRLTKYTLWFTVPLFGIISLYFFLPSKTHLEIGNTFFGENRNLYNITAAQFFFWKAAHPTIGKEALWAHYQLGRTYFIQGRFDRALVEENKELSLHKDNIRTYYMLGLIYGYLDEEEKAVEAFAKFIEWKPESWAARNDKAWLEFRVGKIDDALTTITPVAYLTENPWVQNTYGVLLMNKKRYTEAKQAFLYAQAQAADMSASDWGAAYPGNDPRVYETGLSAMRKSIESNLELIEEKMSS